MKRDNDLKQGANLQQNCSTVIWEMDKVKLKMNLKLNLKLLQLKVGLQAIESLGVFT